MVVGKKKVKAANENPFPVDPTHLQVQLETTFEDIMGLMGGCPQPKPECAQACAGAAPQHPFGAFLNMEPSHLGEQIQTFMQDIHASFTGQPTTSGAQPREAQSAEGNEEKTKKTEQEPEPMDGLKEAEDEEWVKPNTDDLADMAESKQDKSSPEATEEPPRVEDRTVKDKNTLEETPGETQKGIARFIMKKEPVDSALSEENKVGPVNQNMPSEPQPHQIRMDISGYQPDEVVVATQGHKIRVSAKHVEGSEGRDHGEYSFQRTMNLPDNVDVERMTWEIEDKVLVISVPFM